jgi:hypothetical protein
MSLSKHQQKLYKKEKEMKERLKSGQTPEERAIARAAATADAQAAKCSICLATFAVSQLRRNPPMDLVKHCEQKHPKEPIPSCFGFLNPVSTLRCT